MNLNGGRRSHGSSFGNLLCDRGIMMVSAGRFEIHESGNAGGVGGGCAGGEGDMGRTDKRRRRGRRERVPGVTLGGRDVGICTIPEPNCELDGAELILEVPLECRW